MPANTITVLGLTIQDIDEILAELQNGSDGYPGFFQIYGPDINLLPGSPDGNALNVFAQSKRDVLELAQLVYSSFDPQQAFGVALDRICAINGVIRQGGTYTQQVMAITVSQGLTLPGLNDFPSGGAFVVQDGTGNQYALATTYVFSGAGTVDLNFQAVLIGSISSLANTITTISTPQLGVTSVNNPAGPITVGTNQETDSALRIRRANSVELPSKGFLQGLLGALLDIPNVTQALVLENDTGTTDANGIPGHSIWCIVAVPNTTANNDAVAQAIYVKRNAGCGMKGSVVIAVTQIDGTTFNIKFDYPTPLNLYFTAAITAITGTIDETFIQAQILAKFGNSYLIGQTADSTSIVAFIKQIAPNASVSGEGVSLTAGSYTPTVAPTAINDQFFFASGSHIILT